MQKPRNRRQVSNCTLASYHYYTWRAKRNHHTDWKTDTTKYCKSSEKVCPAGPPGYPGLTGAKRPRGGRGPKGKKGPQGPMGPLENLENQEWRVVHDRKKKRETREGLGQNGMPGATGRPGKTGKTGPKRSRGERKIWENPGQKACRDQRNWEPWKIDICSTGNDVTCRSD